MAKSKEYTFRLPMQVDIVINEEYLSKYLKRKCVKSRTFRYKAILERKLILNDQPNGDTRLNFPSLNTDKRCHVVFNYNEAGSKDLIYYLNAKQIIYNTKGPLYSGLGLLETQRDRFVRCSKNLGWDVIRFDSKSMALDDADLEDYYRLDVRGNGWNGIN